MNVLVIDIGGSHVKVLASGQSAPRQFDSNKHLTPDGLVKKVGEIVANWQFDVITLGYPGQVRSGRPAAEPGNLGHGWVGYDFSAAFAKRVRIINDAAMQAIGAFDGGRMLFLGLGTGLGSALVIERVVVNLELGCVPWGESGEPLFYRVGKEGLEKNGRQAWLLAVNEAVEALGQATSADYVVLGGGHAGEVHPLPPRARRGANQDAFTGGFRLWEEWVEPHDRPPSDAWRVFG
ncbi:MAG TPA: hypothetical protein VFE47_24155 [Tepidisphaeraceae bacterium]|jgi:polyphosphate glucokinase|nr:hypothetical protein [Tepidisphaeraceae bacterium]